MLHKKIINENKAQFLTCFQNFIKNHENKIFLNKLTKKNIKICVNYKKLNALISKNCYLIFLIHETLNTLCNTKYYTKMNIIAAFNKFKMTEREKWKTAFLIRYDFFEYLIILWELQNVSVTFQHFINSVLHEFLDKFVSIYLNDIIIYLKIKKKHWKHVTKVLQVL